MSISSQLTLLAQNKAAIKAAIEAKSPTVSPGDALADWPASIASIPSGGGGGQSDEDKPVKFYEYDGTLLHAYTADEAQALTELPAVPAVSGRTSQGWNYTLAQMKAQVTAVGSCTVGHNSLLSGTSTVVHIEIRDPAYKTITVYYGQQTKGAISVNWGDGSSPSSNTTSTGTTGVSLTHTYSPSSYPAEYTITFTCSSGYMQFRNLIFTNASATSSSGGSTTSPDAAFGSMVKSIDFCPTTSMMVGPIFGWYSRIESVGLPSSIANGNTFNYAFLGCSSIHHVSLPDSITKLGNYAFDQCVSIESVSIPPTVTSIGTYAFSRCGLKRVSIPSSVTSLGNYAFSQCSRLESVVVPSGATLGDYAFQLCSLLKSVTLPSTLTSISTGLFMTCKALSSVSVPSSVTTVGANAFNGCSCLKSISLSSYVTSIGNSAFSGCYLLESITLPSTITTIGTDVFRECISLKSVTLPSGISTVSNNMFYNCYAIQSITLPATGLTSIGTNAFYNCKALRSITLPSGITTLGNYSFYGCSALQSIVIPSSVTTIGTYVFQNCMGIKVFDFSNHTSVPTLSNANAFQITSSTKYIVVPDALYDTWTTASNWNTTTNQIKASIIKKSDFDAL